MVPAMEALAVPDQMAAVLAAPLVALEVRAPASAAALVVPVAAALVVVQVAVLAVQEPACLAVPTADSVLESVMASIFAHSPSSNFPARQRCLPHHP